MHSTFTISSALDQTSASHDPLLNSGLISRTFQAVWTLLTLLEVTIQTFIKCPAQGKARLCWAKSNPDQPLSFIVMSENLKPCFPGSNLKCSQVQWHFVIHYGTLGLFHLCLTVPKLNQSISQESVQKHIGRFGQRMHIKVVIGSSQQYEEMIEMKRGKKYSGMALLSKKNVIHLAIQT